MFRGLKFVAIALATLFVAEPAIAQYKPNFRPPALMLKRLAPPIVRPPLVQLRLAITPSEAAAIAQGQFPGSKVVKVKLKGKIYSVTVVNDNTVVRIMVSGLDGSIM